MKKEKKFTIENTGGVSRAELSLSPGVNVLLGRNGAGKTSCIDAVVRASGGKAKIERKDGTQEGRIEGPGIKLTLKQVVKADGLAELELADVGPLGRLIDPRLKSSEAAASARIRALVELVGLGVDDRKLLDLCDGNTALFEEVTEIIQADAIDNLLEASEKLRRHTHSKARDQEELAAEAEGEIKKAFSECQEILAGLGGPEALTQTTEEEAAAELERGIRTHDRALANCEARELLEKQQGEIRAELGPPPNVRAAELDLAEASGKLQDAKRALFDAEEKIHGLRARGREAEQAVRAADEARERAEAGRAQWQKQNEILEKTPEGPSRADLGQLLAVYVESPREVLGRAQQSSKFRQAEKVHDASILAQKKANEEAEALRKLANGIPGKLGEILASAGAGGFTVIEGRLHIVTEAGPRDFEHRCSTGERARAALSVASQINNGRVLALDGEVWNSLDPSNRAEFAAAAREHDLCVITEQPDEGLLRMKLETGAETKIGGAS